MRTADRHWGKKLGKFNTAKPLPSGWFTRLFAEAPLVAAFRYLFRRVGRWCTGIRFEAEAPPCRQDGKPPASLQPRSSAAFVETAIGRVTAKGLPRAAVVGYSGCVSGLPHL
jgi:hypothetical protein